MVKPPQSKTLLKIKLCNSLKNNMDCLNNKIQNSTSQLDMVLKFFQYVIGEMKQTNLDEFFAKQPTLEENLTLFNELVSSFLNDFSTLTTRDEQMLEFMAKAKQESTVSKLNGKLENMSLDDLVIDAAKYEPEFPSLPVKIEVKVTISFANSPSDFYVQAYSTVPESIMRVQAATNELIVKGIKCLPNMAPGMHCVARYKEDFYWYRAKIISINADKIKVFFFDFGNAEEVDTTWIMPMAKSIASDKAMAVACHFAHYKPEGGWSQQAISAFKEKFKTNNVLKCLFYDEVPRISEFGTYPYYPVDVFLEDGAAFMNEIVDIDKKQKKSLKSLE